MDVKNWGQGNSLPPFLTNEENMKKIFLFVLALMFIIPSVFADRNTSSFSARTTSGLIQRGDWKIYRISFIATTGVGTFAIYDGLTPVTAVKIRTEGSQATTGNDRFYDFTKKPLEGSTGLYLEMNNGSIVIEYE